MSYYSVYNLVTDGVAVCIETVVSIVTRCVVSYVVILLLGYINKMFNIGGDTEDSDDQTRIMDIVPYSDSQFRNMTARAYRKHIIMLENQVMKLNLHLENAYRVITVLKRENEAFRRINSQAHHLIADFKRKNSRLFLKSKTSDSAQDDGKYQHSENAEKLSKEEGTATTKQQTFRDDYVCIRDGDKFVFGKPIYTNEKVVEIDGTTESQTVETDSERGLSLRNVRACTNVQQSTTVESSSTADSSYREQVVFIRPPVNVSNDGSVPSTPSVHCDTSSDDVIHTMTPPPKHIYVDVGSGEEAESVTAKNSTSAATADDASAASGHDSYSESDKIRIVPKSVSDSKLYILSGSSSSSSYEQGRSDRDTEGDEVEEEEEEETSKDDKSSSSARSSYDSEARKTDVSGRRSEEDLTVTPEDTESQINSTEAETRPADDESDTLPSSTSDLPKTFVAEHRPITESVAFKKFIKSSEASQLFAPSNRGNYMSRFISVYNRPM